jgi:hypothetical protein
LPTWLDRILPHISVESPSETPLQAEVEQVQVPVH